MIATNPIRPTLHHTKLRRMSCRLLTVTLRSIGSISAVERHEDVLEIRPLHVGRPDVEPGEGLHERVDLAFDREADDVAVAAELSHPRPGGGHRPGGRVSEQSVSARGEG